MRKRCLGITNHEGTNYAIHGTDLNDRNMELYEDIPNGSFLDWRVPTVWRKVS